MVVLIRPENGKPALMVPGPCDIIDSGGSPDKPLLITQPIDLIIYLIAVGRMAGSR